MENTTRQKMTLADYLARRGKIKALTSLEAGIFGVPYPLVGGWARTHGAIEITDGMITTLRTKIGDADTATRKRALQGLDSAMGIGKPKKSVTPAKRPATPLPKQVKAMPVAFRGFALRGQKTEPKAASLPWE